MKSETIKQANTKRPIHHLIRSRWSARSYSEKAIPQTDLETLLEAASWAFSANNSQPWHYFYAHHADTAAFQKIWSCLLPGNQPWCANAAVLLISCIHKVNDSGKPNNWAMHDLGAANATLMLQATAMGIYGHPMAGFDKAKTIETFKLNADILEPVAFIALGYLDEADKLDEPFKTRELTPRTRKGIEEVSERMR